MCVVLGVTLAGWATPAQAGVQPGWVGEQVSFITSKQLPDGAILSSSNTINPYFANIAAMGLARANTTASRAALGKWMTWYLSHLNRPDVSGLSNTVYDYSYDPVTGAETASNTYDSVDSYASTALNVAYLAYQTGDPSLRLLVSTNISTYEAIANLLNYPVGGGGVRSTNYLTIAKPSYQIAYLMDNAEVYSGLSDFSKLETALGRTAAAAYYGQWASTTQSAITGNLWNGATRTWDWALGSPSNLNRFYADSAAQLWPVVFGVVPAGDSKATAVWAKFTAAWPDWMHGTVPDAFPWTVMASASQRMGDRRNADLLMTSIHQRYAPNWTQPSTCTQPVCGSWYDAEAGWFLLANTKTAP